MISFVMAHDFLRGQIGSHANDTLFIRSFMVMIVVKKPLTDT